VARLDLAKHVADVGGGKFVPCGFGHSGQLDLYGCRMVLSSSSQRLTDPLCDRHSGPTGGLLNLQEFLVIEQNLQALAHGE